MTGKNPRKKLIKSLRQTTLLHRFQFLFPEHAHNNIALLLKVNDSGSHVFIQCTVSQSVAKTKKFGNFKNGKNRSTY